MPNSQDGGVFGLRCQRSRVDWGHVLEHQFAPYPNGRSSSLAAEIRGLVEPLRALVAGLSPNDVPLPSAPDVLAAFVDGQRVLESGRMLMTARAAETSRWKQEGYTTPADWLAGQQGTSAGRARADLETSGRLDGLDATADALRAGLLSPEQAGAVSDAASINPAAEQDLLDLAQRESLRATQREADRRKAEAQSEADKAARDERVRRERNVRTWYRQGTGYLGATGPIADIRDLEQRLNRQVDRAFREPRPVEEREPRGAYAFDALMRFGRSDAGTSSRPPVTRMTLIRVDLAALARGSVEAGEVCEIGGIAVSITELRRLLGESILQLVLTNGDAVIDIVNLNRKPTVAQRIAALFADARCAVEGCERAAVIELDHEDPFAEVRETRSSNLSPKCDHHHDQKTYGDWQLIPGTGRRPMVPPTDPRHPRSRSSPDSWPDTG